MKLTQKKNFKKKYNIILDIDETLVHCKNINNKFRIILRPYLKKFLEFCYLHFNVGYWTIGVKDYCTGVLQKILTKEQYDTTKLIIARNEPTNNSLYIETINNHLFRLKKLDKVYTKSLHYLFTNKLYSNKFNMNNTIIIDNNPYVTAVNPNISILIPSFYSNRNDNYLLEIISWLKMIKNGYSKSIYKMEKPNFFTNLNFLQI